MDNMRGSILIIDDEALSVKSLTSILRAEGYDVKSTAFGTQGVEWLSEGFDIVILDLKLPDADGLEVLKDIKKKFPAVGVIVISAFTTVETAIEVMNRGAFSFLPKPFEVEQLLEAITQAMTAGEKEKKNARLLNTLSLLYQVSKEMEGMIELHSIAGLAVQYLHQATNIDVCAVMLFDHATKEFYFGGVRGVSCDMSEVSQKRFKLDEKLYTQLVRKRNAVHIPELKTLPEILRYLPLYEPKSLFMFPLAANETCVGIALFISQTHGVLRDEALDAITTVCGQVSQSFYNANRYLQLKRDYLGAVAALMQAIESKDKYMRGHSEGVAELAGRVARKMNLSPREVEKIHFAGLLHDIGNVAISEQLLLKKDQLTTDEYYQMKMHTIFSSSIVRRIDAAHEMVPMVLYHHERYDGSGYPEGLKGEAIPLGARIIAVCDAFKAITSERSYRRKMSREQACRELQRCAGTQFDPVVVKLLVDVIAETGV